MFNLKTVRNAFFKSAIFLFILICARGSWAQPTDCQTALASPSGFDSLSSGSTATRERGVEEWDGEILRFTTTLPGVITIQGSGPGLQSSLYTDASSGPYPLLDSAEVGTSLPKLEAVVPAGDHCIEVTPGVGEDTFEIAAKFTDVCHLGDADDHGDSTICSTLLTVDGEPVEGEISSFSTTDVDRFKFYLAPDTEVAIESSSTEDTDVEAELYRENGTLEDSDDDSAGDGQFRITVSSPSGWYYVRVKGANGPYAISVTTVPAP